MAKYSRATMIKMEKEIVELKNEMAEIKKDNLEMKGKIVKLKERNGALKSKIERIVCYIPEAKKFLLCHALSAELVNELFASLPMENALRILAKMPNGLLARNLRKMLKSLKMAMKNNKFNEADCGPKLSISKEGLEVKHTGPNGEPNCVRCKLPIKMILNFKKPSIAFYFEVHVKEEKNVDIGFCDNEFPLEGKWLGERANSIGISCKEDMFIDGIIVKLGNGLGCFQRGDVIGIGLIHFPANSSMHCFTTCNGKFLDSFNVPSKFRNLQLFPAFILVHKGDTIKANFGNEPWRCNSQYFKRIINLTENKNKLL